jgi:hypothetical protein
MEGVRKNGTAEFGLNEQQITGRREKKLHNEEIHNLYSSPLRQERGDMQQARYRWEMHTELL